MAKILVVDDDESLRNAVKKILTEDLHEVFLASDGEQAEALLSREAFDLVITDIRMPRVDGFQLMAWIRSNQDTPVIAMTGFTPSAAEDVAMANGADEFLSKPFRSEELKASVERCLKRTRRKGGDTSRNRVRRWLSAGTLVSALLSSILGIVLVVAPRQDQLRSRDERNLTQEIQSLRESQEQLRLTMFGAAGEKPSPVAQSELEHRVSTLEKQTAALSEVILHDPVAALSITMLRRDLDALSAREDRDTAGIRENLSLFWEMRFWIVGIILTVLIAAANTVWGSRARSQRWWRSRR